MELPSAQYIRGLRATAGALHRTLHAIALAECDGFDCSFDASPMGNGHEYVVSPTGAAARDGFQSAEGDDHCYVCSRHY